jgi:hypothetical protein
MENGHKLVRQCVLHIVCDAVQIIVVSQHNMGGDLNGRKKEQEQQEWQQSGDHVKK